MKKAMFAFLSLVTLNLAFAQHGGHGLSKAKLAHDASHRIGKFVDTGKLNEGFINKMSSLEIKSLPHNAPTDASYTVLATAGSSNGQTLLTFDENGKFISNKVIAQVTSEESPFEVASSEIIEAALHWAMVSTDAAVKTFNTDLVKASLKQQKNDDGSTQAVVELTSSETAKVLQIVLSGKGEVLSSSTLQ